MAWQSPCLNLKNWVSVLCMCIHNAERLEITPLNFCTRYFWYFYWRLNKKIFLPFLILIKNFFLDFSAVLTILLVNFGISFYYKKLILKKKWETEVNKFFYCKKFIFLQGSHLENWHTFGTQVSIGCMKTLVQ